MAANDKTLKDFWRRFHGGVEVAAAGSGFLHDKLLGIRDGFCRFFGDCLELSVPVSVTPHAGDTEISTLPLSDQETLELARGKALALRAALDDPSTFVVASEAGLLTMSAGEDSRTFVRSWTVVFGLDDEAWGSSGSLQIPTRLLQSGEAPELAVPGTRRGGGMVAELTGNLETRRTATCLATVHALSTLFYGLIERRPGRR